MVVFAYYVSTLHSVYPIYASFVFLCRLLPIGSIHILFASLVSVLDPSSEDDMIDTTETGMSCVGS